MSVEWYAPVVLLVGVTLWLLGSVLDATMWALFFCLFGGGAAFLIGQATIQPVSFFVALLLVHVLASMFSRSDHVQVSLKANRYFVFYCLYAAATAMILPRMFNRALDVPPLAIQSAKDLYYVTALHFTKQNYTTAAYILVTLTAAICGGAASRDPRSRSKLVTWALVIAWLHIGFGIFGSVLTSAGGADIVALFRNAKYAQLTQTTEGFVRIDGIFPETSSYAAFAFPWFVLMTELWLRNVSVWRTGVTAAALAAILIACTSTTAYVGLAGYILVLGLRWLAFPRSLGVGKLIAIFLTGLAMVVVVMGAVAFSPKIATTAGRALAGLTVHKLNTQSGEERLYWSEIGLKAFKASYGLGIGAGSFRSSSLLVAIIGSTGVVGVLAFGAHLLEILKPARWSTYPLARSAEEPIEVSTAWAAVAGLFPAMVALPSPDPGVVFAVLGGLAVGWRYAPAAQTVAARVRAGAPGRELVKT